jgi:hypothetical protein
LWGKTAYNNQADQINNHLDDPNGIVLFCEDGCLNCGVHGCDATAQFFPILAGLGYKTDTTGLAFRPDVMFMFVSFQGPGVIWKIWREDGFPFTGNTLDIK